MSLPILLGVTGKKRAGKSTVAEYLQHRHAFGEYHFAKPIKEGLMVMFGLTHDQVYKGDRNELIPGLGKSVRDLMTSLANDWGHDMVCPDVWVAPAKLEVMGHAAIHKPLVISDVRRDNEAEMIVGQQGKILRITSDLTDHIEPDHEIETGINDTLVHETIHWSGVYSERALLYVKLDRFLNKLRS